MGAPMAGIPLFQTPPWAIGAFYAVLGFAFGALAERTNYCVVIATHRQLVACNKRVEHSERIPVELRPVSPILGAPHEVRRIRPYAGRKG